LSDNLQQIPVFESRWNGPLPQLAGLDGSSSQPKWDNATKTITATMAVRRKTFIAFCILARVISAFLNLILNNTAIPLLFPV